MKRLALLILLSLVAAVLAVGAPVSAAPPVSPIYIDKVTLFEPGTKQVYFEIPGDDSLSGLTNKAAKLANYGKLEEALVTIDKAIKVDPSMAQPYYNKGMILYNMGRYEDAIKAFDWGIKIDPTNKGAQYRKLAESQLTK